MHEAAQQPGRQRRLEQHRALPGADLARLQARQGALGRVAPDGLGRGQFIGTAHRAVPGVALHPRALAGDRRHRNRMARAGVTAAKAPAVGAEKVALLGRHPGTLAVGDALVGGERSPFAGQRQAGRVFAGDVPGMEQVQVGLLVASGDVLGVGQPGHRVFGGEAGDVVSGLHRLLHRRAGKVGGAGIAAAMPDVHRDAQRLVAVAFHVFQFALAHRHAQAAAFGGLGAGVGRAQFSGMGQGGVHQLLEESSAVGENGVAAGVGFGHSGAMIAAVTRGTRRASPPFTFHVT